jgi:GTP-binding protein
VLPVDGSDPVDNAKTIINELKQHSDKIASKPRWLVLNKLDLLLEEEAKEITDRIVSELDWQDKVFSISAFAKIGTKELTEEVMTFIETLPDVEVELSDEEKAVEFKWDAYHQEALSEFDDGDELDDDDWDEDDYDVEVEYRQ